MRRKTLGSALVLVLLSISAFAASSAFALPEVGRCQARAGGKYADANCTVRSVKGTGTHEFVTGAAKTGFTSEGGEVVLEGGSGTFVCQTERSSGRYDADGSAGVIRGVENVVLTFTNCSLSGSFIICSTPGFAEGEFVTNPLRGNLGYISGEKTRAPVVGQELTPEAKGGAYLDISCGGGAVRVVIKAPTSNCIISTVAPVNVADATFGETWSTATGSMQVPTHFQRTPTRLCQLETSVNGGARELLAQRLETTITNEEALELRA